MTTTSQIPKVIDYVVAQANANAVLGQASPVPVIVLDGPQITDDTLTEALHLWIGHDPLNPNGEAAVATQDFAEVGNQASTRDEHGEIVCTAEAWAGGTIIKAQRDSCAAIVAAVELMFRGLPASGGPGDYSMGGLVLWASVTGPYIWYQEQRQSGSSVMCVFKITYEARLLTG